MNENSKRPMAVTVLACLYIAVGAGGFVAHLGDFRGGNQISYDALLVEAVELLAIAGGVFLLRGHNWARWLALAWMIFHVFRSAFNAWGEFTIHIVFCAAIAWFLFRPDAARYFGRAQGSAADETSMFNI